MMAVELRVRVVGGLVVGLADRTLAAVEVGSRKARLLLALLAVCGGYVPTDRIVGAVWGDAPPRDPAANVATLVSRLRATLGAPAIEGGGTGYRLGDQVRVDLNEAADLVAEAESLLAGQRPAHALMAGRRAAHLLDGGEVLAEESDAPWVEPARAWHGELLRRARHTIADAALRVGDVSAATTAAEAAEAAVASDELDEAACRMLMRAYHAAGEPARALLTYHRLRTILAAELGVDPAQSTRDLFVSILRTTAGSLAEVL